MSVNKKKPISITLAAAIVICIITFILGFVISSFAFLDSRIESANEKNAELTQLVSEKEDEIKELKSNLEQKDENNIILAEQIQTHLKTIESLNAEVAALKDDVTTISEAAINSTPGTGSFFLSFAALTPSQQLIILVLLLVILIFIISVSCSFIAVKSSKGTNKAPKAKKEKKQKKAKNHPSEEASTEDSPLEDSTDESQEVSDDASLEEDADTAVADEPTMPIGDKIFPAVEKAIDLLYHNNLEDSIADLGGFKFGITNFDEVLSDKRRPKSFGNSENGDFVAFMSTTQSAKKLYIIPRTLVLSDSTVALRGVTDLFNLTNEAGERIDHGTVKIKQIVSPAVFACGDAGWAIEAKGEIVSLGTKTY